MCRIQILLELLLAFGIQGSEKLYECNTFEVIFEFIILICLPLFSLKSVFFLGLSSFPLTLLTLLRISSLSTESWYVNHRQHHLDRCCHLVPRHPDHQCISSHDIQIIVVTMNNVAAKNSWGASIEALTFWGSQKSQSFVFGRNLNVHLNWKSPKRFKNLKHAMHISRSDIFNILLDLISDLRSEAHVFANNEDSEIQQIEFKSSIKSSCFFAGGFSSYNICTFSVPSLPKLISLWSP